MWRVFLFLLPMLPMLPMHELYRLYGLNYKADIEDAVKSWFFFEALKLGYLIHLHPLDNAHAEHTTKKVLQVFRLTGLFCGERGIRTPGTLQYAGFQDRCIRPLCHLSMQTMVVFSCLRVQRYTMFGNMPNIYYNFFADCALSRADVPMCRHIDVKSLPLRSAF